MKISHFLAFLGGAAIGALTGILCAPDSGKNTRQKIIDILNKKGIKLSKEQFEAFIAKVKSKLHIGFTDDDLDAAVTDSIDEEHM